MKSIALNHFPQVRFEGSERRLYNSVLRKRYKNRPEERVRLKWLEYLLYQTDWKKSRIGFEAPVQIRQEKNALRADLILYNKQMKPEILVECKASSVSLTQTVAEQAARYNVSVDAPYICLTNGINDFWFELKEGSVTSISSPLRETAAFSSIERTPHWWVQRGFCSSGSSPSLLNQIHMLCTQFWSNDLDWPTRYLDFTTTFLPLSLNHYYRVPELTPEKKMAITFIGSPDTGSYLISILNKSGQNSGFLAINLDKTIQKLPESAILFKNREENRFDAHKKLPLFGKGFNWAIMENLPNFLMRFFD
jgi:hypothetical protein